MAKTTIRDSVIANQMQESLNAAGIENRAALDKLMSTTTIEKILSDSPAVYNYFKLANLGLSSVIEPKDLREVRGSTPSPDYYREYFDNQITQPTPYFNFIPAKDLFNPQALGASAGFTPEQIYAYQMILTPKPTQQPTWSDVEAQGSDGGGSGYGGGAGKSMAVHHGSGGSNTKALAYPPPPPGGPPGYAPPPPAPGSAGIPDGNYGGLPGYNYDPSQGTAAARAYVDANFADDPNYGWFTQMFGRQDLATGITMSLTGQLNQIRQAKQAIANAMASGDPRQITALNYQMQTMNTQEQEIMDKMMRVQHYNDEFMTMVKGLMDVSNKTLDTFTRNMRVGG